MTSPVIQTIPALPFGMLNAFLLKADKGAILIDTGLPNALGKIKTSLAGLGMGLKDLRLIIVTHGHIDHAGSAKAVADASGAPVLVHALDLPYCQGVAPILRPSGPFGRLFQMTGAIEMPFASFEPDILVSDAGPFDLARFGVAGQVVLTPGHTPGSVSVLLENGDVFAGDLLASGILLGGIALKGRPKSPPFEEDPKAAAASLTDLLNRGAKRFFLGHGGPLGPAAIRRHIAHLEQL
jgi:hydroxyacylglutathione hydrolase